jgi:hypothetical protein
MRGMRRATAVAALGLAVVLGVAGCAAGPPKRSASPGFKKVGAGGAEVVGYLGRSDLEGGFWAVYGSAVGSSSAEAPAVLAVLLPGSVDEAGIAALKGRYVWAAGRLATGASIRMAGPEIKVDGIDTVMEP